VINSSIASTFFIANLNADFSVLGVLDIATWEGHFRSSDGTNPVGGSTPSFDANIFESNITTANRIN
jgi:hypothetical protein